LNSRAALSGRYNIQWKKYAMPTTQRIQEVPAHCGALIPMLLDTPRLEKSEIVANACMNRQRNLAGANSYEKDLGFNPLVLLNKSLEKQHEAAWLDLCCGTGRALIQAAEAYRTASLDHRVKLTGVDLVPMFDLIRPGVDGVRLVATSVERWETEERFDLVTCVHGLHYIGDKLGLLQRASSWLRDGGLLMVHLDYRNLRINGRTSPGAQIGRDLRRAGFRYVAGRHLLTCSAQTPRQRLPYRYMGADDQAGPNYTGQAAVDSYYERVRD
jgi:SAM-dependent methyltransferase